MARGVVCRFQTASAMLSFRTRFQDFRQDLIRFQDFRAGFQDCSGISRFQDRLQDLRQISAQIYGFDSDLRGISEKVYGFHVVADPSGGIQLGGAGEQARA